jgi:thioredoxin reductase (NADPH)
MSSYLIDAITAAPNVVVRASSAIIGGGGDGRLQTIVLQDHTGQEEVLPVDGLFVMIGAEPGTKWLGDQLGRDEHGYVLAGADAAEDPLWKQSRHPQPYESTIPGLFAVGDVRCGSVKRVASAVGEGSVVVTQIHAHFKAAHDA